MKTSSLGDLSDVVQPGSIPNPVVKHVSADGTTGVALWESRSSPGELFYAASVAVLAQRWLSESISLRFFLI